MSYIKINKLDKDYLKYVLQNNKCTNLTLKSAVALKK